MHTFHNYPRLNQRMVFFEIPDPESFTSKTEKLIGVIPKDLDKDVEAGRDTALNLIIQASDKIEKERGEAVKKLTPDKKPNEADTKKEASEDKYISRINKAAESANKQIDANQEDYFKIEAIIAAQCTCDLARKENSDFLGKFGAMDPAEAITACRNGTDSISSIMSDVGALQIPSNLNPQLWKEKVNKMRLVSEGLGKSYKRVEDIVWAGVVKKIDAKDAMSTKIAASNEAGKPPVLAEYRVLKGFLDELDAIAKPFEGSALLAEHLGKIMAKKEAVSAVVQKAADIFAEQDESFKTMNDSLSQLRAEYVRIEKANPDDPKLTELAGAMRAMRATMNPWADRLERGQPLNEFPRSDIPDEERIDMKKGDDSEKQKALIDSKDALMGQIETWNKHEIICPISSYRELRNFRDQINTHMSTMDGDILKYARSKIGRMDAAIGTAAELIANQDKHFKMMFETLKQLKAEYIRLKKEDPNSPQLNERARAIVDLGKHLDAWAERMEQKGYEARRT